MISPSNIPWCEKYRAQKFSEIKGQDLAIEKIKVFFRYFPKKKAIILYGGPGTGKTSLAYAIAYETDSEVLELNASDLRDKAKIAEIIGPAIQQRSLFKKNKIILVDEVDGISATRDKGGLGELLALVEKTQYPIVITANDIWQQKFNLLRQKAELVQLKELDYKIIALRLKEICKVENCAFSDDVITSIAVRAKGDIRAAINDLQIMASMKEPELLKEIGERNKEETIFSALQYIFKNAKIDERMIGIFDEVNMPIDEIFLWIEENIPLEYKGRELFEAINALSLADVFRGRIIRQRHYRFMVYEYFFLGAGVASPKKYNRVGWTNYKKPTRVLKIWLQNQRNIKKQLICEKYAKHCHISTKKAMMDWMLIKQILKNKEIRDNLRLTEEEIAYLDKPIS